MKRIPLALVPSFTSYATTRCLLVKITCKGAFEGQVFGFTNLDDTITYQGVTYNYYHGFTPSAIETRNTTSVDNGEILGFMLEGITYEMIRAGLMNGATIECYEVDYMRLENGHTIEFVGKCGETKFSDNTFTTEIRSLTQGFVQAISQTYSKDYCRARFGDRFCKMPLVWVAGTVDSPWEFDTRRGFNTAGLAAEYFPGVVRWTGGRNAGDEMDVIQSADGFVRLMLPMPFPIEDGDTYLIRRDCDKSVAMCKEYGNEPNYRMEPLMNLTGDGLYSYTPAKIDNNYGSMIGAVIGAIIGYIFFYGNWQAGAQIGGAIGGLLLPDTMSGPRLSQAATQTNSTAAPIPYGWGKVSMSGNVIEDGKSIESTKKKKNFLGITTEKTFHYHRSFKIAAMEGRINKFLEIRRGGKTVAYDGTRAELLFKELLSDGYINGEETTFDVINEYPALDAVYANSGAAMIGLVNALRALPDNGGIPANLHLIVVVNSFSYSLKRAQGLDKINTTGGDGTMRLFYGTETQEFYPCKDLDTKGLFPAYRGLAYIAYDKYDVTPTGGALDSFEFVIDATPGRVTGTSLPYVQLVQDDTLQRLSVTGGSLDTILIESFAGPEQLDQELSVDGGAMYDPPPAYTDPENLDQDLAVTSGQLITPPPAEMEPDALEPTLAPTDGTLVVPPLGEMQDENLDAGLDITAGALFVPTGHRYWRVNITANNGHASQCGFTEIELKTSLGGPDITATGASTGAATASSQVNSSNRPPLAVDDNTGTGWLANATTGWWRYDCQHADHLAIGQPFEDVVQITIRGSWNAPTASPQNFTLDWSDDNVSWTTVMTVTGETGWTGASDIRTFDV